MQAWSKISMMPARSIKTMQDELVKKMVRELAAGHPYYRDLLQIQGVDAGSVQGAADLQKLPFTTKEDMMPREADPFHPRKFVLEPPAADRAPARKGGIGLFRKKDPGPDPADYKLNSLCYTAGRTAEPVPIEYTRYDLENLREAGRRAFDIWGITRDDTILNAFSYAPNVSFWQMYYSGMAMGSTALQTGGGRVLGMEKILRALSNMEAPVLATHPGYAQAALQTLDHFGIALPSLERFLIGMDYTPMAQVARIRKMMSQMNTRGDQVQRIYFISEAKSGWAECEPGFGYHINPDHALVEIVDPETGAILGEGEAGEVVITNLDARGTVVLRFRTGDIATEGITSEPCPHCNRTVPRILGDIERRNLCLDLNANGEIQKFNGNALRLYMTCRDDVLLWYAEITRSGESDTLAVTVKGDQQSKEEALKAALEREMHEQFKVPVTVETCSFEAAWNKVGLEKYITNQHIFDLRG